MKTNKMQWTLALWWFKDNCVYKIDTKILRSSLTNFILVFSAFKIIYNVSWKFAIQNIWLRRYSIYSLIMDNIQVFGEKIG